MAAGVGGADVSATGRTFVLRPVTSTDSKTGVVTTTNYVEPPEELEAAWNFLNIANVYLSQADQLLNLIRVQLKSSPAEHGLPIRHLYGHAVELYLKSFLRAEGVPEAEIRNRYTYGHHLELLYDECNRRGLAMNSTDAAVLDAMLQWLKQGHEDHQFRYFEKTISTADPDLIRPAVHIIARVADTHIQSLLREVKEQAEKDGKQVIALTKKLFVSVSGHSTPEGKVPITVSIGRRPPAA
jgi:hypothetical protein